MTSNYQVKVLFEFYILPEVGLSYVGFGVLYVPCFGVSFCTDTHSVCLHDIYLGISS